MTGSTPGRLRGRLLAVLAAAVLAAAPGDAAAQRYRSPFKLGSGASLRPFKPVVTDARKYTARVRRYDERAERWVDASLAAVVTPDGLALTKASEMEGDLRAEFRGGDRVPVRVLATDARSDLALVRLGKAGEFADLPTADWADGDPEVGRWLVTPGPGVTPVAIGVVSVKPRTIPQSEERAVLGITMAKVAGPPQVESVREDTAADRAGLQEGDVIRRIDGLGLVSSGSLGGEIARRRPGDVVTLDVERDGERLVVRATLRHVPPMTNDKDDEWNRPDVRTRWEEMNGLGSRLSERRHNFPWAVQHDTVLKPEDCGGPVLNIDGRAVGLNIARAGRTESFYIPASQVVPAVERLRRLAAQSEPRDSADAGEAAPR